MAGRQAHGRAPDKKPKAKNKSTKRALEAFAIASYQTNDNVKIRKNRLGAQEGGNRPGKRHRDEDEDEEDKYGESTSKKPRKAATKGRFDELNMEEGSDSEGNEWKMGQVDSDDDSDLDSDDAFGESDEARFEGFAFSGSSNKKSKKEKPTSSHKDVNLDEDDEDDSDSELEEGDLGEGAVDLADMLDDSEDEEDVRRNSKPQTEEDSESREDDDEDGESDEESSASSADDDETSDPAKIAALQSMIANLSQAEEGSRAPAKQRSDGASEYNTPSDFGLTSKTKLTLEDLGLPNINDPHIKKSLKFVDPESKVGGRRKAALAKLEVPLARRQQDKLDRSSAYDKTKETLDRWKDTVMNNRKADHLMFPLPDQGLAGALSNTQLVPTTQSKPFNELEATIQSILEESGLSTKDGRDDEAQIRQYEDLEAKKLSIEDIKARRQQLRLARDLLFREEAKAKRIKKIKSKAYRKVHRKQREKEDRLNKEALEDGGYVPSEDELEAQDRRRAHERMSAKHRGSKWAKATKETGRAAWDEDARDGITEMARRDEELRKRVEGKAARREFDDSDASSGVSDDDHSDSDEAEERQLLGKLDRVSRLQPIESAPGGKLANMKFMLKSEETRRKNNDAMIEEIRRDLAGEESPDEEEEVGDIGRRIFGPASKTVEAKAKPVPENEFEAPEGSDFERNEHDLDFQGVNNSKRSNEGSQSGKKANGGSKIKGSKSINQQPNGKPKIIKPKSPKDQPEQSGGAWSKVPLKATGISDAEAKRRRHKNNDSIEVEELDLTTAAMLATQPKSKKTKKTTVVEMSIDSDDSDDENTIQLPFAIRDQNLIKRAFAGADVVGEFEAEKLQTAENEDDKVVDNTLPGWGAWVGDGLSKRAKARNKGKVLTKVEGIKAKDRKDAKLDRVIINQKRIKKNGKYLATQLPHPFENRAQYERSLRLPVGPEWATKETLQATTKPRILVKQGIIAPMSKPLM
ncbi:Utp14 protein-domain-containing protein [Amylocarpus encephaloides]|uniref:Utp14 protein-domain-containing protein n=1 Tax=Amylocarpus encephaloides TaxID=45428 RepID=A0A9P7YSP9_9HELO|nr:Utp14 protein-domain-containing protein [Amylocarpus encephaloides]